MKKSLATKKILLSVLASFSLCLAIGGGALTGNSAKALPSYPFGATTVADPLYDFEDYRYSQDALDSLAKEILNDPTKDIDDLISHIKGNALTNGLPIDRNNITLKYGRYRNSQKDPYNDLIWMPVYMSTTNDDKKDAVLTLYLATCNGPLSQYEYSVFSDDAKVTPNQLSAYPSNMYGTSYMRAVTLGNGGAYASYTNSGSYTIREAGRPAYEACNKYLDFLEYSYTVDGETETRKGNLYDDIVTPSQIAWQSYENYQDAIGANGTILNGVSTGVDGGGATWGSYCWPNEAYGKPNNGSYFNENWFDYGDKAKKTGYDSWKNDKVWLPSLTEVGTGDISGTDRSGLNGIWKLDKNQRANDDAGGSLIAAQPVAWLRTADTYYNDGTNTYSTAHIFVTEQDGSIGVRRLDTTPRTVAVRPAIHLNLSKAVRKTDPPVNLPDKVTTVYNGAEHKLDNNHMTLKPEEAPWFKQGKMNVRFAYDKNMASLATPVNAGEYYMEVTLDDPNLYFVNSDDTRKIVKFVIEKAEIGVTWTYDGNIPTAVALSSQSSFYQRDIDAGNTPEIGIKYKHSSTSGLYYYSYDDLLRGNYFAEAYIIDDDLYNYNYKLSDSMGEPVVANSSFEVGRKIVDVPIITGAGDGAMNKGVLTYTISYKGNQYIQVENVSKHIRVSVSSTRGGVIKCLNEMKDGYPVPSENGTLAYQVADVDQYTFEFSFPNSTDYTWPGSYDFAATGDAGADTSVKKLAVIVDRAEIEVVFNGLPNEWFHIQTQQFTIELRGIYEHIDGSEIPLDVTYVGTSGGGIKTLTPTDGVYTLTGLTPGNYSLSVGLNNSASNEYNKYYRVASGTKTQPFKVIEAKSTFNDNLVNWQYNHGTDVPVLVGNFLTHDSEENARVLDYDGEIYAFSLTLSDDVLRDTYYVKAEYKGEKYDAEKGKYVNHSAFIKNGGKYRITVTISGYYKNVQVDAKEYTIYAEIRKQKYDLTSLQWDYTEFTPPFVYDAARHRVGITPDSLALLPGLNVEYETEGDRITAGTYTTNVKFSLSGDYAENYVLPVFEDDSTYDGTFAFSCSWLIKKAELEVEWKTADDSSSTLLFVPVLKKGHEYVDYTFERKEADGSWVAASSVSAEGATERFRVKAELKADYAVNYELKNNTPCEFDVPSGKYAVSIHFEKDGAVCHDGDQFSYTGEPVTLDLVVDSDNLTLSTYAFKYYSVGAGDTRTELSSAPSDVGKYVAVVTAKYSADSYISEECASEVSFEIVKADYDAHSISWIYEHGKTVIAGYYDAVQDKWVDEHGNEVTFAFEYDGTPHELKVVCVQEFDDPADEISVLKLQGNSATDAGDYQAAVDFVYNQNRFNNPNTPADPDNRFPRILKWSVTKKKINYDEVRWGYITPEGEERDFDFDKDSFRYTRNEDGPVSVRVALLGIPQGVQDLLPYKTKCLSSADANPVAGNSFAAIGEYMTSYDMTGITWAGDANHEPFDAASFPASIPTSRVWSIKQRELSKIDYDGSWTTFDDRVRNVIDICKIPYDELCYFKIEITFIDRGFTLFNDYAGYKDVANTLYHAGTYDIRIYEKSTTFKDGAEKETEIIWDTLTIDVERAEVEVRWDEDGAYPIARASSVFTTDMLQTYYTRLNDAEVPLAYIKSSENNEKFYAKVKASDDYAYDIVLKFGAGQPDHIEFSYSPFNPKPGAIDLEKPTIVDDEIEFTGSALTFEINGWDYISQYLYISAGSLVQTAQGEYSVVLRFYKNANAYWKDSPAGEYNRDSLTLTFRVTPPTKWALDYPTLEKTTAEWTGEEIEIKITNWVTLSKYLDYEVFYLGVSMGKNLYARGGGIYEVVFTIPADSIGYWKDDVDDPKKIYYVQFRVTGDPNPDLKEEITDPTLSKYTETHTGSPIQFRINNWNYYSDIVTVTCDGAEIKDDVIEVTEVGVYEVVFTIKEGRNETFAGGELTCKLKFSITGNGNTGEVQKIAKPTMSTVKKEYNGEYIEFSVSGWASIYSKYLVISCDNADVVIVTDSANNQTGVVRVKNIGKYSIKLSFKEGVKACWTGDGENTDPVTLSFEIERPSDPSIVITPSFDETEKQYNGKDIVFDLSNFNPDEIEIVEGVEVLTQKGVGEYIITLRLKNPKTEENPDGQTWDDKTTADKTIKFKIVAAEISDIKAGSDGKPVAVDESGNPIDVDLSDLIDVKYYDADGNEVAKEDLVAGQSYTVKYTVKDEAEFDKAISGGAAIRDKINAKNEEGGYPLDNYTPGENPTPPDDGKGDGMNPLWWIAIGGGALALLIVIILIIALSRRGGGGGYDDRYDDRYDEGYDDYDDYDDDDDEDDDDYDDYDDEY